MLGRRGWGAVAKVPSVKGSVFGGVVEEFRKLVAGNELTREQASRWLRPGDLDLIDAPVSIASWYDVGTFARLNELLRDVVGGGSNEYLRERGRESARRLLEGGLYSQLEYLQRTEVAGATDSRARHEAFGRDIRRLTTISGSIYNFATWTPAPHPDHALRYVVELTDAAPLADPLCWRAEGFMNHMAAQHGDPDLWSWRRLSRDVVRFEMTRDL
jgi:hypothetical protein